MKNTKIYKKAFLLLAISSISFQTVGCADNKEVVIEESIKDDNHLNEIENENNKVEKGNKIKENKSKKILEKIDAWMSDTNNILNYNNIDKMNSEIEQKLIFITDFVIFGGSITLDDGTEVSLSDCTDEAKGKIKNIYSIMLVKIEEKCPGTINKVGNFFNSTKNHLKDTTINAKEYMGEKISNFIDEGYTSGYYDENTYNFMKEFKKQIGPQLKKDFNNGKETIKDIYNKGKNIWNEYMDEYDKVKTK